MTFPTRQLFALLLGALAVRQIASIILREEKGKKGCGKAFSIYIRAPEILTIFILYPDNFKSTRAFSQKIKAQISSTLAPCKKFNYV